METDESSLDEMRLEELLRILEFRRSCSEMRQEKIQTKMKHLKERQDNLQQRILQRLNKDGVHLDIDTLRKRARESALLAAQRAYDDDDNNTTADVTERVVESTVPHDVADQSEEEKADEPDRSRDDVQKGGASTMDVHEKLAKLAGKGASDATNKKLDNIQEETSEGQDKDKTGDFKEKKTATKAGSKRTGEKRFKKVANATKFMSNVSKSKKSTSQKSKGNK